VYITDAEVPKTEEITGVLKKKLKKAVLYG